MRLTTVMPDAFSGLGGLTSLYAQAFKAKSRCGDSVAASPRIAPSAEPLVINQSVHVVSCHALDVEKQYFPNCGNQKPGTKLTRNTATRSTQRAVLTANPVCAPRSGVETTTQSVLVTVCIA